MFDNLLSALDAYYWVFVIIFMLKNMKHSPDPLDAYATELRKIREELEKLNRRNGNG